MAKEKKKGFFSRAKKVVEQVEELVEVVDDVVEEVVAEVEDVIDAAIDKQSAYTIEQVNDVWVVFKNGRKVYDNPKESNAKRFVRNRP